MRGRPVFPRTAARIFSPSSPRPWKAYGDVRGLNAPPRSNVAPAAWAICAACRVCSAVSTAHGPAMSVIVPGPIGTPPTRTTERVGWFSRLTSLYGTETRSTSLTPSSPRRLSVPSCSMSPTRPAIVRVTPRLTNASPPAVSTSATTVLISAWVASGAITITMVCRVSSSQKDESPGPLGPGLSSSGRSAQRLAGHRPRDGPVAIKVEAAAHGSEDSRCDPAAMGGGGDVPDITGMKLWPDHGLTRGTSAARAVHPPWLAGPALRPGAEVPAEDLGLSGVRSHRVGRGAPVELGGVRAAAHRRGHRRLPLRHQVHRPRQPLAGRPGCGVPRARAAGSGRYARHGLG